MLSLIQNEWMKWWTMKKSKIVLALYVLIAVGVVIIAKMNDVDITRSDYYMLLTILFGSICLVSSQLFSRQRPSEMKSVMIR